MGKTPIEIYITGAYGARSGKFALKRSGKYALQGVHVLMLSNYETRSLRDR